MGVWTPPIDDKYYLQSKIAKIITQLDHPQFYKKLWESFQLYLNLLDPQEDELLENIEKYGITKALEQYPLVFLVASDSSELASHKNLIKFVARRFYKEEFINTAERDLEAIPIVFSTARLNQLLKDIASTESDIIGVEKRVRITKAFEEASQQLLEDTIQNQPALHP